MTTKRPILKLPKKRVWYTEKDWKLLADSHKPVETLSPPKEKRLKTK